MSNQLPTGLLVDAVLTPLNAQGLYYYIHHKGNHASGLIVLKLADTRGSAKLWIQERNFMDDVLEWVNPLAQEVVEEKEADAYIARASSVDPDVWVIEIEDPEMVNPFDV